jgi:hypothetical protein
MVVVVVVGVAVDATEDAEIVAVVVVGGGALSFLRHTVAASFVILG